MGMYYVYELAFPDHTFKYGATNYPKEKLWNPHLKTFKFGARGVQDKIDEVGWENVKFTVLAEGLSKEEANRLQMNKSYHNRKAGTDCTEKNLPQGNWYSVYTFTFPDGTKFVGLTYQYIGVGVSSLYSDAWGDSGNGFNGKNDVLYRKIKEVGWQNIQKNVLATNLSKKEAYALRAKYRAKYMNAGLWFSPRRRALQAEEMIQLVQEAISKRLDQEMERAIDDKSRRVLEFVKVDVLPECLTDLWHELAKK